MTDLHVEVYGEGEPAIFVHGMFGWGLDTFPHQRALADEYRIILVDRRGYGDSPAGDQIGWHIDNSFPFLRPEAGGGTWMSLAGSRSLHNDHFGGALELKISRNIFQEPSVCFLKTVKYLPSKKAVLPPAFGVTDLVNVPREKAKLPEIQVSSLVIAIWMSED